MTATTMVAIVIAIGAPLLLVAEPDGVSSAAETVKVDESGLDLSRRSGLFALYQRLQDASMRACDPSGQTRVLPWYGRPESDDCYIDTLQAALASYANNTLEQIHFELQLRPVFID
jgi:UrcA family protein